jgi:hypothetical protein
MALVGREVISVPRAVRRARVVGGSALRQSRHLRISHARTREGTAARSGDFIRPRPPSHSAGTRASRTRAREA